MPSEAAGHADFTGIRYAQCWEDADILLAGLEVPSGATVVSICSAGDNSLSLLAAGAGRVVALDLSPAQIACLGLRIAAYRTLTHPELLELIGSRPSTRRAELYAKARTAADAPTREFWDARPALVEAGIGSAGKFERYFRLFAFRLLPLIHDRATVLAVLEPRSRDEREAFYARTWDNRRWRMLFRLFFSRTVMGWAGRDPAFFRYVEGSVADRILARSRYAMTGLDPSRNPYMHWVLTGTHGDALPHALRAENFDAIREGVEAGRIEGRVQALEDFLEEVGPSSVDSFNLSDIFEYVSEAETERILGHVADAGKPGARIAYWNMLAPRQRPESLADRIVMNEDLSRNLFLEDKAWFYSAFHVEEVR